MWDIIGFWSGPDLPSLTAETGSNLIFIFGVGAFFVLYCNQIMMKNE